MRLTEEQYTALITRQKIPAKENKYHAKQCVIDGFTFPSIAEGDYYKILLFEKKVGLVTYFLRQVPFHLPGNIVMRIDYLIFYPNDSYRYRDVKGAEPTREWINKRKQVEQLYGIKIDIIKKAEVNRQKARYGIQ